MQRYTRAERLSYNMDRIKKELNPFPGRPERERTFITRCVYQIADVFEYHLNKLELLEEQPLWLPEAVITPHSEAAAIESRAYFEDAKPEPDGYITSMHNPLQRATNRVRISSWYRNADNNLYMTAMIAVSPLPCDTWGALPLTLAQWRIIIAGITLTHLQWKWIHAVRKYWSDDTYEIGGTFGWYLEPCKKLTKENTLLWTGQAIYEHVARKYSERAQT